MLRTQTCFYARAIIGIDLDIAKDGETDGLSWLAEQPEVITVTSITPSGGKHLLFQCPPGAPGTAGPRTRMVGSDAHGRVYAVDIRCKNSGLMIPPSRLLDGGEYKWEHSPGDTPVAVAPDWLLRAIAPDIKRAQT